MSLSHWPVQLNIAPILANKVALSQHSNLLYTTAVRLLPRAEKPCTQEENLSANWREERNLDVQQNITYFLACLEKDRQTQYIDRKQPDAGDCTTRQPDCLVKNQSTGGLVAIEYSELRVTEDMPRMRSELNTFGFTMAGGLKGQALANRLAEIIDLKKVKNQFAGYPDAERILLLRDWISCRHKPQEFSECSSCFQRPNDPGCDHCYIILRKYGDVLQLF